LKWEAVDHEICIVRGQKFAGIIGPAIFGFVGQLMGNSRWGIISVTLLFIAGARFSQIFMIPRRSVAVRGR
jgi:MFS-type transporter involved in bile tolerance (Atg22 family)